MNASLMQTPAVLANETQHLLLENVSTVVSEASPVPYYGEHLARYQVAYTSAHGYLSVLVCLFGITANAMNIVVLTRKNMLSATNAILTGLAVADCLVMLSYVPFSYHNYLRKGLSEREKYTYAWAVFALCHAHLTVSAHTVATWLTVTAAVWRVMAVCYPATTLRWRGVDRARVAVAATYLAGAAFCLPFYLTFSVQECGDEETNATIYKVNFSEVAKMRNGMLASINFWLFSVMSKLVPCVALTVLSAMLLRVLYHANMRRKILLAAGQVTAGASDRSRDRTTRMLLAVLFLFLVTQFPSGILALLSGALGDAFFQNVYLRFGETMDALSLVNSSVNFVIYCAMSHQFRVTFAFLFLGRCSFRSSNWAAVPPSDPPTNTLGTACV